MRQLGVQEIDIVSIVKPITKYAVTVLDPPEIRYHLEKAVWLARTRPSRTGLARHPARCAGEPYRRVRSSRLRSRRTPDARGRRSRRQGRRDHSGFESRATSSPLRGQWSSTGPRRRGIPQPVRPARDSGGSHLVRRRHYLLRTSALCRPPRFAGLPWRQLRAPELRFSAEHRSAAGLCHHRICSR